MSLPNAIVLVIDRLGAGFLGPYGNTWIETPTLNRLASESLLLENVYSDSPTLASFYRAAGMGLHACSEPAENSHSELIERITAAGVNTTLLTDEPALAEFPFAAGFLERFELPEMRAAAAAESIAQTQTALTCAAALEFLEQARPPFLLWLHLRGMAGRWDAPREFRESLADEDDPEPPHFVDPPDTVLPENPDPDELLGMNQAYAGQVMLIDSCLLPILQAASTGRNSPKTLVVLTSPRGYPLGEHGRIGGCGDGLCEESLHLPMLIRHPEGCYALQRCQSLIQPADLHVTLAEWFNPAPSDSSGGKGGLLLPAEPNEHLRRECIASIFQDHRALRTPAWFFKKGSDQPPQLYVKPADRWEVNEVADRCADIVEELAQVLATQESCLRSRPPGVAPPLSNHLLEPAD